MRKFCCGLDDDWGFYLSRNYYDGPFWELKIFRFWACWNLGGLPYLFQDKG